MTWSIAWTDVVKEDLRALPRAIQQRIIRKVVAVGEAGPYRFFRRLRGDPGYRMRVGDYRVIADLDEAGQCIMVLAVGHRKNVYDRRNH